MESEQPQWQLPSPRWQASDLGNPIPDRTHACSVCMPLWQHNVAYEEGDAEVVSTFRAGYPRFFMHPLVCELREQIAREISQPAEQCLLLPSAASAARCAAYVRHRTGEDAAVSQSVCGAFVVNCGNAGATALKEYWQHAGEGISSRVAESLLAGGQLDYSVGPAAQEIRERVADLQHVSPDDVYLYPSGMAAIFAAWRITRRAGAAPIQFGFPYVDTYKILERFGDRPPWFYPQGSDADIDQLQQRLTSEPASALFCEVPGNPLLDTPDVTRLAELAAQYDTVMVVDDTLGAMINTDVRPVADLIATSLTKFFSGGGDVLAGSLIVSPDRPHYARMKQALEDDYENLLSAADADVLASNCQDVVARVQSINEAALALVNELSGHPAIDQVYYPSTRHPERFEAVRDREFDSGGYGGLLSVVVKDGDRNAPQVFDALEVSKGPNLGTNFTLCCPYTILAHYDELDFASRCGVSPHLLRISVGLEGADWVIAKVRTALDACQT